ncbi:MAG: hypothetical protein V3S51_09285 [Dehalococcoidia bacterium]
MIYLEVAYHGVTDREAFLQKIIYPCLKEDKVMGVSKVLGIFSPADGDTSDLSCILVFKDMATYEEWGEKGKRSAVYKQLGETTRKEGPFYASEEATLTVSTEYDAIDWES